MREATQGRFWVLKASEWFRKEIGFRQVGEASKTQRKVFEIRFPKRQRNQHSEFCFHTEHTALVVSLLIFLWLFAFMLLVLMFYVLVFLNFCFLPDLHEFSFLSLSQIFGCVCRKNLSGEFPQWTWWRCCRIFTHRKMHQFGGQATKATRECRKGSDLCMNVLNNLNTFFWGLCS